jgi:hypothetical protein
MNRVDVKAIAAAIGIHKRNVERRAARESWPYTETTGRGGRRRLYEIAKLPSPVQAALALKLKPHTEAALAREAEAGELPAGRKAAPSEVEIQSRSQWYARLPERYRREAERRLKALDAVEALRREGQSLVRARELVAATLKAQGDPVSPVTLWRWASEVERVPRPYWLYFLAPQWTGRTATADCSPEAWDAFRVDYLRLEAPTAAACYERTKRLAAQKGWTVPSLATLLRRVEREIAPAVRVLAREGDEALMRMYPAQERDRGMFVALEAVNADGHRFDVFVRHPGGQICRPTMVAFQDLYSGKILAHRYGETECADLVRLALSDVVRQYGIPAHAWLDNGRAFASKYITGGTRSRYRFKVRPEDPTGIAVALGIQIHWATPYHGQAKPIERAFRDLCDRVAKHPAFAGAYTGNDPSAKPENYGSKAIDWADFVRVADAEIAAHNAREGRRSKVAAGRSCDQVFAESYARVPIRKATADQLRDLLLSSDAVRASPRDGSVTLAGNRYWTEALSRHAGERVMVRFDPDALHGSVHVYDLQGAYIAEAACIARVGFADQAAATDHARARAQYRRATKQALAAEQRMQLDQLVDQLDAVAPAPAEIKSPSVVTLMPKPKAQPQTEAAPLAATGTDRYVSAVEQLVLARIPRAKRDADN